MFRKSYFVREANNGDGQADAGGVSGNETTTTRETQTANADIQPLANADIQPLANADINPVAAWFGDNKYYQTGSKAGQLRHKFRAPKPRELSGVDASKSFEGLDTDSLRTSAPGAKTADTPAGDSGDKKGKPNKAEKKLIEAKTGAKLAMRMLDTLTMWISRGQFGRDFSAEQTAARNEYRAALEQDWQDYLITLDIPMHPGLVVAFGSMMYTMDAFSTPAGQERAQSWKAKVGAKIGAMIFSRGK